MLEFPTGNQGIIFSRHRVLCGGNSGKRLGLKQNKCMGHWKETIGFATWRSLVNLPRVVSIGKWGLNIWLKRYEGILEMRTQRQSLDNLRRDKKWDGSWRDMRDQ